LSTGVVADIARVGDDLDNLRATLDRLLDSGDAETALRVAGGSLSAYWVCAGGQLTEGRAWLDRALREGEHASATARGWGLFGLTALAIHQGDSVTARSAGTACVALAREGGDQVLASSAPYILCLVEEYEGRIEAAAALAAEALEAARNGDDPGLIGWALYAVASVRHRSGDFWGATAALEESLAIFRGFGGAWGEADALTDLGQMARDQGNLKQAVQRHADSLIVRRDSGQTVGSTNDVIALADIAREQGHLEAAARLLGAEETSRTRSSYDGFPLTRRIREQMWQALAQQLGNERFGASLNAGRALSTLEMIAEALAIAATLQSKFRSGAT
jgi:non-specific serine/threonine protein kinase